MEAIKKHTIDEDVCGDDRIGAEVETDVVAGFSQVPSEVGRLREQEGPHMGTRGESQVRTIHQASGTRELICAFF